MNKMLDASKGYGHFRDISPTDAVTASAPCRIDMGGTLDIPTFYFPLQSFKPLTVNFAVALRTEVRLSPYKRGHVKISSRGFESAEYSAAQVPFDHPMGLMFAVVAYFGVHGLHVRIQSPSPPKSGLGGSSAAAVALVAAMARLGEQCGDKPMKKRQIALLAQSIESAVNMVPCGYQDQLAAAFGGVNAWEWQTNSARSNYRRQIVVKKARHQRINKQVLIAYTGLSHVSSDINGRWVRQFLSGRYRRTWLKIISLTRRFGQALSENDTQSAVDAMNAEVELRRKLTPDVLGPMGRQLVKTAVGTGCGARFTGAGGGGCIWAIGANERVQALKPLWEKLLTVEPKARLIDHGIDDKGVVIG